MLFFMRIVVLAAYAIALWTVYPNWEIFVAILTCIWASRISTEIIEMIKEEKEKK